jgi:hypothetical protein
MITLIPVRKASTWTVGEKKEEKKIRLKKYHYYTYSKPKIYK